MILAWIVSCHLNLHRLVPLFFTECRLYLAWIVVFVYLALIIASTLHGFTGLSPVSCMDWFIGLLHFCIVLVLLHTFSPYCTCHKLSHLPSKNCRLYLAGIVASTLLWIKCLLFPALRVVYTTVYLSPVPAWSVVSIPCKDCRWLRNLPTSSQSFCWDPLRDILGQTDFSSPSFADNIS